MGVGRVFVLAFAADFFADWPAACRCSPGAVPGVAVICYDEGIAEFLDLGRQKADSMAQKVQVLLVDRSRMAQKVQVLLVDDLDGSQVLRPSRLVSMALNTRST
jgi:hypothetical protein